MALLVARTASSQGGGDPGEWIGKTAHYVRAAATGTGSGDDWTNAYTNLPSTLTRDHVYYVANGSYGNYDFDDATNGSQKIYIVKAVESDHGDASDWNSSYASQATFGTLFMTTNHWVLHGQTRTETPLLAEPQGYGFRIGAIASNTFNSQNGSNSKFAYLDVGAAWSTADWSETVCGYDDAAIRFVFTQTDIEFERCVFHNSGHNGAIGMMHGSENVLFDHCDFYFGWGKATVATPNVGCNFHTFAHCRFWNGSGHDLCEDVEGGGITTELGTYSYSGTTEGNLVYGCIFYSTHNSGGRNSIIQFGESSPGPDAVNCKVFNNTFVNIEACVLSEIMLFGGSGNEVRNNLFYNCDDDSVTANTASNNVTEASDPFVDSVNLDFRLASSIGGGASLGSPYDVDPLGNSRSPNWDVGAYAFAG